MNTEILDDIRRRVTEYFGAHPNAMTLSVARDLDVPEAEVVANLPDDRSASLDPAAFEQIMKRCALVDNVHVIVSNTSVTMESTGTLGGFSKSGDFFNVQSDDIDMHIRSNRIARAFAVRKPSHMSGVETLSVQFFDPAGDSSFKVFFTFGQKTAAPETRKIWESLKSDFGV